MFIQVEKNAGLTIRANLAREMALRSATQSDIAERLGVSQSTVSRYLEYADRIPVGQIMRIAQALECDFRSLLDGIV